MTEARLLTTEGSYVTTITLADDATPPTQYRYAGRVFTQDRAIEIAGGDVVWIYTGPPDDPPEPEPAPLNVEC